jgi:cytidylate kinase
MAVITISKQFAAGGVELAERLAAKLGYKLAGKKVLTELAQALDLSEAEAELMKRGEEVGLISKVDNYLIHTVRRIAQKPEAALDDQRYFQTVEKLVRELAAQDNVILLGWGAQVILAQAANARHFRVVCPLELRGRRLAERNRLPLAQAMGECQRQDGFSQHYVQHYLKQDWAAPELYHLTINLGHLTFDFDRAIKAVESVI